MNFMNRRLTRLVLVLGGALLASSCDKDALNLAQEALKLLEFYEQQLDRKLSDEHTAYIAQAQVQAQATREQAIESLAQDRMERARSLALDFLEGQKRISRWREPLRDYANADYRAQRDLLLPAMETEGATLAQIQKVEVDRQKVAALRAALTNLTKKPGLVEQATDVANFVKDVKTDLDKRVCDGLTATIAEQQKAAAAPGVSEADKKKAQTAVNAATEQKKARCS
jgi:hypothetical protein